MGQHRGALAATEITDADQPDPDGSDDATGAPDSEISETTSAPDAFGDEPPSGSDDAGGDEESSDDAGGSSSSDSSSSDSSSGGSSGGGSGSSSGGSSDAGTLVDSGSDGATGTPIVDASTEPPADAYDSGTEASTPADAGSTRDSGASRPADSGSPWSVAVSGGSAPGANDVPALGDDDPAWGLDASFGGGGGAWEDGGGGAPDLGTSPSRAVLGCAGCTVPDAGGGSRTAAWLLVAVGLGARVWRRRRR